MSNLTRFALSDAQLGAVDTALGELEVQLKDLVALSPPQRKSIKRMGEKSESFCRQALRIVDQNPQIVPPKVPVADAVAQLATLDRLRPRLVRLARLAEMAGDTDAALGSDIMTVSLQAYGLLKLIGRADGLEGLRKELSVRFAKGPRTTEPKAA
jgi:hypothetical protein